MSKRRKWIILGLSVFLVGFAIVRQIPVLGTARHLRELRAQGIPTSGRELNDWYRPIPARDNEALVALEAVQLIVRAAPDADPYAGKFKFPPAGEPIPEKLRQVIAKQVERNQPALARLREVKRGGPARFPMDLSNGPNTLVPHLAQLKSGAQLLKLEAIHAACTGDTARAVESIQAGFALASTLRDEPLLISQLVRIAMLSILLDAMERTVSAVSLEDQHLQRLAQIVGETEGENADGYRKAFMGERALGLSIFEMPSAELDKVMGQGPSGNSADFGDMARVFGMNLHRALGVRAWDRGRYLELMGLYDRATSEPFPQRLAAAQETADEIDAFLASRANRLAIITCMLVPSLTAAVQKEGFNVAQLRCAQAALAVERYRAAHGGLKPPALGALVPEYISALPADPFDGSALQLELTAGGGFLVRAPAASAERARKKATREQPDSVTFAVTR